MRVAAVSPDRDIGNMGDNQDTQAPGLGRLSHFPTLIHRASREIQCRYFYFFISIPPPCVPARAALGGVVASDNDSENQHGF